MFRLFIILLFYCASALANPATKILLIEDTDYLRTSIEEFLIRRGFAVHSAETVEEALLAWYVSEPDLVLLDMKLPLYPYGEEYYEGGLTILRLAPLDKAKVILSSNTDIKLFSSILAHLIDYNFDGKLMPARHPPVLKELINSQKPPNRIAILNQLEQHSKNKEEELRNAIHSLLLLKQEQVGLSKPEEIQQIREKMSLSIREIREKLLKFQKIQESNPLKVNQNFLSGNHQQCMRAVRNLNH